MKKLEKITPQKEDFSRWYTDVIKNGDLMAYSGSNYFQTNFICYLR